MRNLASRVPLAATIFFGCFVAGCAQTGSERSATIAAEANKAGWHGQVIKTASFDLQIFSNPERVQGGEITIYIEGDGYTWVDGQFPSSDPTPHTPIGLQLALAQPSGAVTYMGRPCQYLGAGADPRCSSAVWTDARFSKAVIAAMDAGINQVKEARGAHRITLVGYSGGAAVAILVSAQRHDIERIVTVAGNLDPQAWAMHMKLGTLKGSLDTLAAINATATIPLVNFVGGKDRVVPMELTERFVQHYPTEQPPKIILLADFDHVCCWVNAWSQLGDQILWH